MSISLFANMDIKSLRSEISLMKDKLAISRCASSLQTDPQCTNLIRITRNLISIAMTVLSAMIRKDSVLLEKWRTAKLVTKGSGKNKKSKKS